MMIPKSLEERFWAKVDKPGGDNACWIWTGKPGAWGYGHIRVVDASGKVHKALAHRVAWQLANGEIPPGSRHGTMCVLHRCDNPLCVNALHLFLGTDTDNMADKVAKGRQARAERHGMSKVNAEQVRQIRATTAPIMEIVKLIGISKSQVSAIRSGKSWATVS